MHYPEDSSGSYYRAHPVLHRVFFAFIAGVVLGMLMASVLASV